MCHPFFGIKQARLWAWNRDYERNVVEECKITEKGPANRVEVPVTAVNM